MGTVLPELDLEGFGVRLAAATPRSLPPETTWRLHRHYEELRRWGRSSSLMGPAEGRRVIERHYAESLAALPLLENCKSLLDIGSGAGFPGLVLAAARPRMVVTLVESRQRKWAFLVSACRAMGLELSCHCLNARVDRSLRLPHVDVITLRGVRPRGELIEDLLLGRLRPGGKICYWGRDLPALPAVARLRGQTAGERVSIYEITAKRNNIDA